MKKKPDQDYHTVCRATYHYSRCIALAALNRCDEARQEEDEFLIAKFLNNIIRL